MNVEKIYFDMDGVLADFDKGVIDILHLTPTVQGKSTPQQDDLLFDTMQKEPHFYYELEPIEGGMNLFRELYEKYGDRVEILSGIPKPRRKIDFADEDKRNWCKKYFSPDLKVNLVFREEKKFYCKNKKSILIDDFFVNTNEWEKNGGSGVLFTDEESARARLKELGVL